MSKSEDRRQAEMRAEEARKEKQMIEEMACTIAKLGRQVTAILEGRVKKQSIVILLAHSTKLPQSTVERVLDAIKDMEKNHLK